jgi:hypothetical protein
MTGRITGLFATALLFAPSVSAFAQISNARAYCAQIRDDDTIRQLPRSLADAAMLARRADDEAAGNSPNARQLTKEDVDDFVAQTSFRCMDGLVWFCSVGANLPCTTKPDTRTKIPEVDRYCRTERNVEFVPMAVTGHSVIYSWECVNGRAVITDRRQLDKRGFDAGIWTPLLNGK